MRRVNNAQVLVCQDCLCAEEGWVGVGVGVGGGW